ncbi:unnamed protein product [Trichogramma brassicae]|uniref:RING-type domain-containing protein n=2 Tax=Trichogramma TaxID=7490 RepID=A0A6H5IZ22_9HYME|nr:RING finger protein 11-like [Trichogramma pretiosum]CAB0042884.1 unnamed protein product [Trichogramma brassicae]
MGNCLSCIGAGSQDNANLLSNSSDPALGIGASQDILRQPSMPYSEMASNYYPPSAVRDRYLHQQSTEMNSNQGIGIGFGLGGSNGPIINDEEQQVKLAKRLGLIQHLPTRKFDGNKKAECVICMMELTTGEEERYLPCMHTYHASCIDDWLLRSLTCPTCMEPVDSALINSYHPTS